MSEPKKERDGLKQKVSAFCEALERAKPRDTMAPADLQIVRSYNDLLREAQRQGLEGLPSELDANKDATSYLAVVANAAILRAVVGPVPSFEDCIAELEQAGDSEGEIQA